MQIRNMMTAPVHTIGFDQTVAMARQRMQTHDVRHLVVLDGGRVVGVVSDRDLALIEGVMGGKSNAVPVEEVMSSPAYTVQPEERAATALGEMARRRLGASVVVSEGKAAGIVTTTDAVRVLADTLAAN